MLKKTIVVNEHANYETINQFRKIIKECRKAPSSKITIHFTHIGPSNSKDTGELDQLILDYGALLLIDTHDSTIEFLFDNGIPSSRVFSVRAQLTQILHFHPSLHSRLKLSAMLLEKESGELKQITYNLTKGATHSMRFIPLILIQSKADIQKYLVNKYTSGKDDNLWSQYHDSLKSHIDKRTKESDFKYDEDGTHHLHELSFFETCLLNILLSDEIYLDRRVRQSFKQNVISGDLATIEKHRKFVADVSRSIRELATNILEHSSTGSGVISCRIYDRDRLKKLKGRLENEYIAQRTEKNFIDLNVLDLGEKSIRQTYTSNLAKLKATHGRKHPFKAEEIDIIRDEYKFEDFFHVDIDKIKNLTHQQNKIISRYGLHYFTHIIRDAYMGYIQVSSNEESCTLFKGNVKREDLQEYPPANNFGTNYHCIIPINVARALSRSELKIWKNTDNDATNLDFFKELDYVRIINNTSQNIDQKNKNLIYYEIPSSTDRETKLKYDRIFQIYDQVERISKNRPGEILLLNGNFIETEGESQWIRLLSGVSLLFKDVIVYNVNASIVRDIISQRRAINQSKSFSFWTWESRVLFYSYKYSDIDPSIIRYGATLLTGSSEFVFDHINKNIWRHHYSYRKEFLKATKRESNGETEAIYQDSQLFKRKKLLYFELVIKNIDKHGAPISLFEQSVQFSLNKEFNTGDYHNSNNRGYKISDTHFRLGSKIHIKDFYYAKRLFHNSFFTTPLSYIISKYIHTNLEEKSKLLLPLPPGGLHDYSITLVGYEDYSTFLTSTITNFLASYLGSSKFIFNHNTIKDGKLSKGFTSTHTNILFIVPIASSFSTSRKMSNQIAEIMQAPGPDRNSVKYSFFDLHLNVIIVGHKSPSATFEDIARDGSDRIGTLLFGGEYRTFRDRLLKETYNWHAIDVKEKIVVIKTVSEKPETIYQKYLIPVYTEWSDSDNCTLCNPEEITNEKCLIETGKSSITPSLIFGYPKTKSRNIFSTEHINLSGALLYGNIKKGSNNYRYFIDSSTVVDLNINLLKTWLASLKHKVFNPRSVQYKKVVILTPASGLKSKFIDLVNEYIFEYAANCLTISLGEDYLENSASLYSDGLHQADLVVYVDDVLSSINSFLETNYITEYIRSKITSGRGIDYCVCLLNRMTYDSEDNLLLRLGHTPNTENRLLYFYKLNNTAVKEPTSKFPLLDERSRYHSLANGASLDSIKELFLMKANKLRLVDIENSIKDRAQSPEGFAGKKLHQLLVLNILQKLFEISGISKSNDGAPIDHYKLNLADFFDENISTLENIESFVKFNLKQDTLNEKLAKRYGGNIRSIILKTICSSPLIYYKEIRIPAFRWIIHELEIARKEMEILNDFNLSTFFIHTRSQLFSKFQNLKFLLKRSVQLKSNYIFHPQFLAALKNFIELIHRNEMRLNPIAQRENLKVAKRLSALYREKESAPWRSDILEYADELSSITHNNFKLGSVLPSDNFRSDKASKHSYVTTLFDESQTEARINEILDTGVYSHISSKRFIYQIISLVKELVSDHETKAIKLEANIGTEDLSIWGSRRHDNRNGNFNQFLRLLRIENTAIIESFWEYVKSKETSGATRQILIRKIEDFNRKYQGDPKYRMIVENMVPKATKSLEHFLLLRCNLFNWGIATNHSERTGDSNLKSKIKQMLGYIAGIAGEETISVHFIVNHLNLADPSNDQLYSFEPYRGAIVDSQSIILDTTQSLETSLTQKMFGSPIEGKVDRALSNLEIYKRNEEIHFRQGLVDSSEVGQYSEVKDLQYREKFSLLVIRISDSMDDSSLYTQAVLTIVSNLDDRLDEAKLRLLLLLRRAISEFLTKETSNNTFLELLENRTIINYQKHLKHGIGNFINYQSQIVQEYEEIERRIFVDDYAEDVTLEIDKGYIQEASDLYKEFALITKSIAGQIGVSTKRFEGIKTLFYEYLIDIVRTIYESTRLGDKVVSLKIGDSVEFPNSIPFMPVSAPITLVNSVIPEIILNQKKYGRERKIYWLDSDDYLVLKFSNSTDMSSINKRDGYGLKMCREIHNQYMDLIEIQVTSEPHSEVFCVEIKIKRK